MDMGNTAKIAIVVNQESGMLLQAIKELEIDPEQSFMVGDKIEDLQAGLNAKVRHNILVKTGKPIDDKVKR